MNHVLLIGYSGNCGQRFVPQLLQQPAIQLFVLVRPASQAQSQLQQYKGRLTVLHGDVVADDVGTLAALLRQHRIAVIVSCLGAAPAYPAGQSKLIQAAVQAQTVTLFFPAEYGYEYGVLGRDNLLPDVFDDKIDQRDELQRAHAKHPHFEFVILSCGTFAEFVVPVNFVGVDIAKRHVRAAGGLQTRLTMTSLDDVGRIIAHLIIERPADAMNEVVLLAGETLTYSELQLKLERATGSQFTTEEIAAEELLRFQRVAEQQNDIETRFDCAINGGIAGEIGHTWPIEQSWNHKHGIRLQTVNDWIEQHGVT